MAFTRQHLALALGLTSLTACNAGLISDRLIAPTAEVDACSQGPVVLADPAPLRRLSQSELDTTLRDLARELGVTTFDPGAFAFPDPTVGDYFSNNARQNTMSQLTANHLMDAAERSSLQLTTDLPKVVGCTPGATADACVTAFIRRFARIAWQRPVSDDEVAAFAASYNAVAAADGVRSGIRAIIELGIQSPDFVYIIADAREDDTGRLRFDGHSVARRLSYFVWGSLPDAELRAAADADALGTTDQLRVQVERMLDDPRAKAALRRFHREWLAVRPAAALDKSTEVFPEFSTALAEDMSRELDAFVDRVVWDEGGGIAQLLADREALVNSRLADFYGIDSPSTGNDDWRSVTLGDDRRGIVTRAAFLASTASATGTSPVKRGVAVLAKLMCTSLTAPANVDTSLPAPDPAAGPKTKKQILDSHASQPLCASCHNQIDPIGFAFEMYDATGATISTYADGQPVETAGTLADGRAVTDATDLVDQLAADPDVAQCYARRWLEWSVGRSATPAEKCGIAHLAATASTSIRDAILELATSDLMLYATEGQQ